MHIIRREKDINCSASYFFKEVKGKKVALLGAGKSSLSILPLFKDFGADVTVYDISPFKADDNIKTVTGENYLKNINADIIIRSPGIPFTRSELLQYRLRGIAVTSESELFMALCPAKTIAVTGSDGKTTTCSVIADILKQNCPRVWLGGNIGVPLLPHIFDIKSDHFAVVELSSFQLEGMRCGADISVITNLSPNHLDVHGTMENYISAKKNIFLHQNAFSRTVLNADDACVRSFYKETRGTPALFSRCRKPRIGAYENKDGDIFTVFNGKSEFIINRSEILLPGAHNAQNYLAAFAALYGYAEKNSFRHTAESFGGVEHRIEYVRTVDGVKYYNDSIATSPSRTVRGMLSLYNERIILIAGGSDKGVGFEELGNAIAQKVKLLILMGACAQKIYAATLQSKFYNSKLCKIVFVNNTEQAVHTAAQNAHSGDIVTLSPACASFDMYKNFEQRGEHFKNLVQGL